jgi:CRP-like cAMP-binding protein
MPHVDLLELPYFQGISIDDLVSLVDMMAPQHFAAQAVLVEEGAPTPPPLYIATKGRVLITKRGPDQKERSLAELDGPTLFGEIELFCQIPPVATARALTPVAAFALTRETFDRLFASRHPALLQFTVNVARVACHRLAVSDEIMTRVVGGDDLVNIRRAVFSSMSDAGAWPHTTGAFPRPAK